MILYLVGDYGNLKIHFNMRWIMLKLLKKLLKKTKEQYAALVYDRSTLSEIDALVIHFTINDQLFLEASLIKIRGKTISYASYRKKRKNETRKLFCISYNAIRKRITYNSNFWFDWKKKKSHLKIFETGKIAGSDQKCSGLKREKSLFYSFFY